MRMYLAAPAQLYITKNRSRIPVRMEAHRLLVSFLDGMDRVKLENALDKGGEPDDYCIDSGAHGWLSEFFKSGEKRPIKDVERHIVRFIEATLAMPRPPVFSVELDLQYIYGQDVIDGWRRDIWKPLEREHGITVCYVWHPLDGIERWRSMVEDPEMRYLGFSGILSLPLEQRAAMVMEAYRSAKRVHGFASVRGNWLLKVPYFSVDSTSWAAGAFFGNVPLFDPTTGRMSHFSAGYGTMKDNPRRAIVNGVRAGGQVAIKDLVTRDGSTQDLNPLYRHAAAEYERFERWYTAYWRRRGVDWDVRLADAGIDPGPVRSGQSRRPAGGAGGDEPAGAAPGEPSSDVEAGVPSASEER